MGQSRLLMPNRPNRSRSSLEYASHSTQRYPVTAFVRFVLLAAVVTATPTAVTAAADLFSEATDLAQVPRAGSGTSFDVLTGWVDRLLVGTGPGEIRAVNGRSSGAPRVSGACP